MEISLQKVVLTRKEREELHSISHNGQRSARSVLRALILLALDRGENQDQGGLSERDIASILHVSPCSINNIKRRFAEGGFEAALERKSPQARSLRFDDEMQERLVALVSGKAPEGRNGWSLRLLADKMVEMNHTEKISHETVRRLLNKANLSLRQSGE